MGKAIRLGFSPITGRTMGQAFTLRRTLWGRLLALLIVALFPLPAHTAAVKLAFPSEAAQRSQALEALKDELAALPKISASTGRDGKRIALVIGNDNYESLPSLQKAGGDAESLGTTLTSLGFTVTVHENLAIDAFDEALETFYETLHPGDTVVLFYSGHGIAFEGVNYLLPTDVPELGSDEGRKLRRVGIDATEILAQIKSREVELALIVLDACRDDPFARDGTRGGMSLKGLAPIEPERGVFVMYSAGVGEKALDRLAPDDPEPNSVFTRKFLPILTTPGLPLVDIAKRTQVEVRELAQKVKHAQAPAYYDQVIGQYYFVPPQPRLYGLMIGVDNYVGLRLKGAVNDAEQIARAVEALGPEKVIRIFNEDARVSFIDYVWRDMVEDAQPGDTIVFSYAGSSAQVPSPTTAEADRLDEVLLLSTTDMAAAKVNGVEAVGKNDVIPDDTITAWMEMAAAKNVNVVLLIDGCYGGGLLDREFANVSFVGASAEDETVLEYVIGGRSHGLASVAFALGIEGEADFNGDGYVTQRELYTTVSRSVLAMAGSDQNPQFFPQLGSAEVKVGSSLATDIPLFKLPVDIEARKAALNTPWPVFEEETNTR